MKIARACEEEGVKIPAPFSRTIKVLFSPDKQGVEELMFTYAILDPNGKTDYHKHDRPELIIIVEGEGKCITEAQTCDIFPDTAIWSEAEEYHQIVNTGADGLKLATVFVPGFPAEDNYRRCLDAANAIRKDGAN